MKKFVIVALLLLTSLISLFASNGPVSLADGAYVGVTAQQYSIAIRPLKQNSSDTGITTGKEKGVLYGAYLGGRKELLDNVPYSFEGEFAFASKKILFGFNFGIAYYFLNNDFKLGVGVKGGILGFINSDTAEYGDPGMDIADFNKKATMLGLSVIPHIDMQIHFGDYLSLGLMGGYRVGAAIFKSYLMTIHGITASVYIIKDM